VTDPHDELTPAERRAFEALSREADAPRGLEDRTVALLQARGVLAVPFRPVRAAPRYWQPAWLVGAIAASLALFATGFAFGQYLGARTATIAAAVGLGGSIAERTQHVERTVQLDVHVEEPQQRPRCGEGAGVPCSRWTTVLLQADQ